MKEKSVLLLFLLLLLLLSGCVGPQQKQEPPRVSLVGIKVIGIQLLEQRFGLTLRVQNPNREALDIDGISFSVEVNDKTLAQGVNGDQVTIPGFGEALLEVEASSTLFGLIDQLRDLEQQHAPIDYRIHGNISLSGSLFRLPFEQRGQFGGATERPAPSGGRGI